MCSNGSVLNWNDAIVTSMFHVLIWVADFILSSIESVTKFIYVAALAVHSWSMASRCTLLIYGEPITRKSNAVLLFYWQSSTWNVELDVCIFVCAVVANHENYFLSWFRMCVQCAIARANSLLLVACASWHRFAWEIVWKDCRCCWLRCHCFSCAWNEMIVCWQYIFCLVTSFVLSINYSFVLCGWLDNYCLYLFSGISQC